jgi:ADP-ribose pyrophosphatase
MPRKEKAIKPAAQEETNVVEAPIAEVQTPEAQLPATEEAAATSPAKPKAAKTKASAKSVAPKATKAKAAAPVKAKAAKKAKSKPVAKAVKSEPPAKVAKPKAAKVAKPAAAKTAKPKAAKAKVKKPLAAESVETAQLLSSEVVYQGPLFRVLHDKLIEPGGKASERDIIRHNGSVVILAIDSSKSKKDPYIVVERQYRHAANQYLWELPAGKLDAGEDALAGAQRELAEETGYSAKKWKPLVEYYASPGFLGESMKVFLAEGLVAGDAHPEDDEEIEFRLVKLSEVVKMIEKGAILDGKTLTSVLLYVRKLGGKHKK